MQVVTAAHLGVVFAYTGYAFQMPILKWRAHVWLAGHARGPLTECLSINKKVDKADPSCFQYHLMIMDQLFFVEN